jgi:hypothetical protein
MSTFAIDLITGKQFLFNETFINSGTTVFSGITSGNNGLSCGAPFQLKLGGTLTCSTVLTRGVGNTAGVEYGGDYSASYSSRSLVDKGYADTKLKISVFTGYSASTLVNINTRALKTSIATYTGTTAVATYVLKSSINTYTGTTAPNLYVCKTNFNTYTGATHTCMDRHAYLSGATFTGVVRGVTPAINDNTTCFATTAYYIGQAGTANPLMNAGVCVGTSNLFARQDHVHPKDSTKLSLSGGTMTGALVIDSNLTVTGTTILRGTTCLGTPAAGSIVTDRTLFWNPTTCAVHAVHLTGGSDSYFYTEKTTTATIAAGVTVTPYLSGTPWTFLAGRYEIYFNAQFGNSAAGGTCLQFLCDNTIIGTRYLNGGQTGGWVSSASLSRDVTMTAGCHCLEIRFSRDANTACVTYGMIRAKRIC